MTTPSAEDLYQSMVLDHARAPRNAGPLPGATHVAHGDNPFCGDRVTVSLIVAGDRIADVRFEGTGCAISMASASMMTVAVQGRSRAEVESLCWGFDRLLSGDANPDPDPGARDPEHCSEHGHDQDSDPVVITAATLGDLDAFAGVRRFPVRVKCARLPWRTMMAALAGVGDAVSTE